MYLNTKKHRIRIFEFLNYVYLLNTILLYLYNTIILRICQYFIEFYSIRHCFFILKIFFKVNSLKEADNIVKNIISGQNGVFVIFNKRRNRIGKPLMRGNFENTRPSIIKRHLSYLDWYFEFYPLQTAYLCGFWHCAFWRMC